MREGRQREFGHVAGEDGRSLPDACDPHSFASSKLDWCWRDSPQGRQRWDRVQSALAALQRWISPRQHLLLTGQHTARRVSETGIAVKWRYADGQVLAMRLNLGAAPLATEGPGPGPVEAAEVFAYR